MPALQVKDFPADLYEDLRACAVENDRSISQQTTSILRSYLIAYKHNGGAPSAAFAEDGAAQSDCAQRPQAPAPSALAPSALEAAALTEEAARRVRIEKRQRLFARIESRAAFETPQSFPCAADIVRQMRDDRLGQLCPDSEGL